ncbi:MAG TPA: chromate efflux transporter [Planctomycetota bacterium]|nr:chromate efflux transporter [Planctomycetota bacterium]
MSADPRPPQVPFATALRFWAWLGCVSFGGPSGQIAIMHTELVERRRWLSEPRFLHALNFCMLLPGPEAQQLATYSGWLLHGARGGIAAGVLFVLPSVFVLLALSWIYVVHGDVPWIAAIFRGLQAAVLAIVVAATVRIARRAFAQRWMVLVAAAAFVSLRYLDAPFPAVILGAGLLGLLLGRAAPALFARVGHAGQAPEIEEPPPVEASWPRTCKVLALCLTLWWTPVLLAGVWKGRDHVLFQESVFFSKAAMVTFGGAYAVLPYVADQAVERHAWLSTEQMMDGLGLAETTPGPLIMVVQFVGFLGGWNHPGDLPPWLAAVLGALLTTWVTFLPCFLWIFLGAPHVERLRHVRAITGALATITGAVVGVILNLAVWFGAHTLRPEGGDLDLFALAVGLASAVALIRFKVEVIPIVATAATAGLVRHFALG